MFANIDQVFGLEVFVSVSDFNERKVSELTPDLIAAGAPSLWRRIVPLVRSDRLERMKLTDSYPSRVEHQIGLHPGKY